MTASLLHSVLRRSFVPALLASCFVVLGTGCDGDDSSDVGGRSSYDSGPGEKCNRRRPSPPQPLAPLPCASEALVMLRAPAALRAEVDTSTLWVRACVDDRCRDYPLPAGVLNEDLVTSEPPDESLFMFPLDVEGLACGPRPSVAAVSLYDTLTKAPLFTDVREISLACNSPWCQAPSVEFVVPDEAFTCEPRGALIRLQVSEPIALPAGSVPTALVCVDGICSSAIFFPQSPDGLEPGVEIDVLVQGVDRSSVEETKHVVELTLSSAEEGVTPRTQTFELSLDPSSSIACGLERAPDFVLPLQSSMFPAPSDPGGGRPPPYVPAAGG